jgi:hypothetical protein
MSRKRNFEEYLALKPQELEGEISGLKSHDPGMANILEHVELLRREKRQSAERAERAEVRLAEADFKLGLSQGTQTTRYKYVMGNRVLHAPGCWPSLVHGSSNYKFRPLVLEGLKRDILQKFVFSTWKEEFIESELWCIKEE